MEKDLYGLYHKEEGSWWWGVGRRTLVGSLLRKYGAGNGRPHLLEIGCGAGGLLKELSRTSVAYGMDVEAESMKYCRERGLERLCLGDAAALPYRSEQFDAVVCVDVLEHLDDDRAALADIYRVLKPGGRLLATVPAFQWLWSRRDVQLHHKRRYTLAELRERVAEAGFRTLKISYINLTVFFPLWLMVKTGRLSAKEDAKISVDFALLPGPVNRVLAGVAALESKVTSRVDLPVGSSIVCVAARPEGGGS
jgi:SAM-dependent methyltransferase